jgi:hypothetical protein
MIDSMPMWGQGFCPAAELPLGVLDPLPSRDRKGAV